PARRRLTLEAPRFRLPAPRPQGSAGMALPAEVPAPAPANVLPPVTANGGECVEVELFWGDTLVSVWQLLPGDRLTAGSEPGCDALLHEVDRAVVVRGDVNGWTVLPPRPLH